MISCLYPDLIGAKEWALGGQEFPLSLGTFLASSEQTSVYPSFQKPQTRTRMETRSHKMISSHAILFFLFQESTAAHKLRDIAGFRIIQKSVRCVFLLPGKIILMLVLYSSLSSFSQHSHLDSGVSNKCPMPKNTDFFHVVCVLSQPPIYSLGWAGVTRYLSNTSASLRTSGLLGTVVNLCPDFLGSFSFLC